MKVQQLQDQLQLINNNRNKLLKQYYQVHRITLSNLQALSNLLNLIQILKYKRNNYLNNTQAILLVVLLILLIVVFVKMISSPTFYLRTCKLIPVYLLLKLVLVQHRNNSSNHNQVHIYLLLNLKNLKCLMENTPRQKILYFQSRLMLVQANLLHVKQLNYLHYIFVETR